MSNIKMVKTTILNKVGELDIVEVPEHYCHPVSLAAKYIGQCKKCGKLLFRVPNPGRVGGARWGHPIFCIDFSDRIQCNGWTEHCHGL